MFLILKRLLLLLSYQKFLKILLKLMEIFYLISIFVTVPEILTCLTAHISSPKWAYLRKLVDLPNICTCIWADFHEIRGRDGSPFTLFGYFLFFSHIVWYSFLFCLYFRSRFGYFWTNSCNVLSRCIDGRFLYYFIFAFTSLRLQRYFFFCVFGGSIDSCYFFLRPFSISLNFPLLLAIIFHFYIVISN